MFLYFYILLHHRLFYYLCIDSWNLFSIPSFLSFLSSYKHDLTDNENW
nr:MAG TPA: hypothetical protein [Caudoviricetes sp.]